MSGILYHTFDNIMFFLKNYNFLLDKYRNLLDINLHNLLTEKETKKIFNSFF